MAAVSFVQWAKVFVNFYRYQYSIAPKVHRKGFFRINGGESENLRLGFEIWKHYQDFFPPLSIIRKWGHKSLFYYFNVKNPGWWKWRRRKIHHRGGKVDPNLLETAFEKTCFFPSAHCRHDSWWNMTGCTQGLKMYFYLVSSCYESCIWLVVEL